MSIEAVVHGKNADLIKTVAALYVKPNDIIADLTYGKGLFWKKTPMLNVIGSDIVTVPERPFDFRNTPYADKAFDIAVLDPPYIHGPGNHMTDSTYQNAATTSGLNHAAIMARYVDGLRECKRIAKRQIWVKCKDEIQSSIQRWSHCELLAHAQALGLYGRDLFVLIPSAQTPRGRWANQYHARKPHSFLWVFDLPS